MHKLTNRRKGFKIRVINKIYSSFCSFSSRISSNFSTVKLDITMNTYKNDKNINKECDNRDVNIQKLQVFGQR